MVKMEKVKSINIYELLNLIKIIDVNSDLLYVNANDRVYDSFSSLSEKNERSIYFFENDNIKQIIKSIPSSSVLIIDSSIKYDYNIDNPCSLIASYNPRYVFSELVRYLVKERKFKGGKIFHKNICKSNLEYKVKIDKTSIVQYADIDMYTVIYDHCLIGGGDFAYYYNKYGVMYSFPQVGRVKIGKYCEIYPLAAVNRGSIVDTVIGDYVKIDHMCQIGHNCQIGDNVVVYVGAKILGSCRIGNNTYIGANAVILPHITIGSNSYIGAGSVVTKNVPDNVVYCGNPAKYLKDAKKPY